MSEHFSALIQNRTEFEKGKPTGVWLDLPATKEQLHEAMKALNISAANPQDFRLHGHFITDSKKVDIPLELLQEPDFDTLNFLAAQLETLDPVQLKKLNAICKSNFCPQDLKRFLDYPANTDCYAYIPGVLDYKDLGDYYLNDSDIVKMPEVWKAGIDKETFGRNAAAYEFGHFTEQGYLVTTGDEWQLDFAANGVPDKYRVMSYPEPERATPDKIEKDAAPALADTKPGVSFNPTRPIELKAEKPAEKMKEITDRLEQGIQELFDSDRYKEYLKVMSKFHNYSFYNTLLIAIQKPDTTLIAGYNSWKSMFGRQVVKGAKGIKVIAPSPYKVKKEVDKIDPKTQKPVTDKNGKIIKEQMEITVPTFKVVSVFDVSQTEGKELPSFGIDELTGNVQQYADFYKATEQASPVPISFEDIAGGAKGYYHQEEKRIAINEGMSELQNLKTLIHEIAHAKLHDIDLNASTEKQADRPDRRTREVQAESVAYAVCQYYGLDTSDYSFGYVAGWSSGQEMSELKASLETIRNTASGLIKDIDKNFAELTQSKEQTQINKADTEPKKSNAPKPEKNTPDYIYKVEANPRSDSIKNRYFLQAFESKGHGKVIPRDVLFIGTSKNCRELMRRLVAGELTQGEVKELFTKAQETEQAKEPDTFTIYQLKDNVPVDYHFRSLERLQEKGLSIDPANYEKIYDAALTPGMGLERIFEKFNFDRPEDFKGHSLSVSDVVVVYQNDRDTAHYVDSIGFVDITKDFLLENPQRATEQSTEPDIVLITAVSRSRYDGKPFTLHDDTPETKSIYYTINEGVARRANDANSYYDYKPGSATAEYRQMVDKAVEIAEHQKKRVDPMYHEKIDSLVDTYARKLAQNMNSSFSIEARVPSILIAGGSNFPVRKKEKQNAARDRNMEDWKDIQGLLDKIRSTGMGGISADDPQAVQKLEAKLEKLQSAQDTMKAVNAYYRKHKNLDGCPNLSAERIEAMKAEMSSQWHIQDKPYPSWALSNNNAEIRRVKERIAELTRKNETAYAGWEFDGGTVEANREDNRLQIFFEKKPEEKTRETLKENGFLWSPKAGAWQRQLNDSAIYVADRLSCIRPLSGKSPVEIQKEARTAAETEKKPSIRVQLAQDKEALKTAQKKGSGKDKKAGLRKELNHAEI